jgi:hypothetical protein
MLRSGYMHEKYIDDGDAFYLGSANLTQNGLDEAHEVGIVAPVAAAVGGVASLRSSFEVNWAQSIPA